MNKFIFGCLLMLAAPLTMAKNKYFTVYTDENRLEYPQCKANHKVILTVYRNQLDSEIARLAVGIDQEESAKSPKIRISAYYNLLLQLTVKRIVIDEMINQMEKFNFEQFKTTEGMKKIVFNTDKINVNVKDRVGKSLEAALSKYRRNELSDHIVETIKLKLLTNTATAAGGQLLKSFGSSLVANLSSAALKGALLSIGTEALAGTVRGGILTLLTMPLMGGRLPPTKDWMKILDRHPELIINPEWMTKAGSQDHPWHTHCLTFLRETKQLEKVLDINLNAEESSFIKSVTTINAMKEIEPFKPSDKKPVYEIPKTAIDNTYVKKPRIIQDWPPFWAQKR
jgi:hypothetical protein